MEQLILLPSRASYVQGTPIDIEIRGTELSHEATLTVWHLGMRVHKHSINECGVHTLPELPVGGYGVELLHDDVVARTAIEVTAGGRDRLRYGFVANYAPGKGLAAVSELVRRLHLNGIQFYDWAYRHADLLGGGDNYEDALGQVISLETVRDLVAELKAVGTASYGYAAVYAVGNDEWDVWKRHALLRPAGEPYSLGDFLKIVDPAAKPWIAHLRNELARAVAEVGFEGFHLDQYGYPKYAATPDGAVVDVAESFASAVEEIRSELPDARLIFNNVNDFPTWRSGRLPQDVIYIEPWKPNVTLGSLARIVRRARATSHGQPIVLAAYQSIYGRASAAEADRAAAFTMATLYSHGATQLLVGESGNVLIDPYYVRNHAAERQTLDFLSRWYDFVVEHDALLLDPAIDDVTGSFVGDYNEDLDVSYAGVKVVDEPEPGAVWRRVTRTEHGLVVHLINLVGQSDVLWDEVRSEPSDVGAATVRFRYVRGRTPQVRVADPDKQQRLTDVPVRYDGDFAVATLPSPHIWQVIHVSL